MVNSKLKFRAWDKNRKKMWSHSDLYKMDCSNEYPFLALIRGFYATNMFPGEEMDVIPMQFTGLYDKNVKEIYEWDIVQIKGHAFQRDERGIGIDIDGNYVVKWSDKMELILAPSPESKEGWLLSKNLHYIEVIGNIFEHKHLLGDKKYEVKEIIK